jgi:hypothetical protein
MQATNSSLMHMVNFTAEKFFWNGSVENKVIKF